ncbi:MAG: SAM-dependent methyltransferase, partial [Tissierellia bacterium]|nr:SAM-dependent methyltransferase [Tissierellia bacterium]
MKQVSKLINSIILNGEFIEGNISNPRKKDENSYNKIDIKPVLIKEEIKIQFAYNYKTKVIHENLSPKEAVENIMEILNNFRQGIFFTKDADYQILISKKGKVKILKKNPTKLEIDLSHNRKKEYIIEEGTPCDFLIRLGVMNKDGKVLAKRYNKFRQINRFLEMVEDIIPNLEKDKTINIIDFGCGKS